MDLTPVLSEGLIGLEEMYRCFGSLCFGKNTIGYDLKYEAVDAELVGMNDMR